MCTKRSFFMKWLSGFFAAPAVMHFFRWMMGWDLMVNGMEFTMNMSLMAVGAFALISMFFCYMTCGSCHGGSCGKDSCCD